MTAPQADEFNPYYRKYVGLVPSGDILATLQAQIEETRALLDQFSGRAGHRYAPDKWSVAQVLGHMIDTERIFAYRAHHIARKDPKPMDGFEQDDYVRDGGFDEADFGMLRKEFDAVRQSTVSLFANMPPDAGTRRGVANQNEVTVRALAWIIAGHELHHRSILREKYL
jgi:hypothetical protein